eukprot:TRINITY_DN47789_c0_g1_i1.p1 TRINITY_DN47789_c0_g1~~TRINITY_DN47789_c0_g1_i1.p1  ORF type:complete len:894 (-),score=65.71 TRINITY_DN47789_c0_g1_i1:81-2762(-)
MNPLLGYFAPNSFFPQMIPTAHTEQVVAQQQQQAAEIEALDRHTRDLDRENLRLRYELERKERQQEDERERLRQRERELDYEELQREKERIDSERDHHQWRKDIQTHKEWLERQKPHDREKDVVTTDQLKTLLSEHTQQVVETLSQVATSRLAQQTGTDHDTEASLAKLASLQRTPPPPPGVSTIPPTRSRSVTPPLHHTLVGTSASSMANSHNHRYTNGRPGDGNHTPPSVDSIDPEIPDFNMVANRPSSRRQSFSEEPPQTRKRSSSRRSIGKSARRDSTISKASTKSRSSKKSTKDKKKDRTKDRSDKKDREKTQSKHESSNNVKKHRQRSPSPSSSSSSSDSAPPTGKASRRTNSERIDEPTSRSSGRHKRKKPSKHKKHRNRSGSENEMRSGSRASTPPPPPALAAGYPPSPTNPPPRSSTPPPAMSPSPPAATTASPVTEEDPKNQDFYFQVAHGITLAVRRGQELLFSTHNANNELLSDEDFIPVAVEKTALTLPAPAGADGGNTMHQAGRTICMKDYRPRVFAALRELHGISAEDYRESWVFHAPTQLAIHGSAGRSGSLFINSVDRRFLLKTIPKGEVIKLLATLRNYYNHIKTNACSIIMRIFGLHRFVHRGGKTYVMVVSNVSSLPRCIAGSVTEPPFIFDLKGRQPKPGHFGCHAEDTVTKDNDIGRKFMLSPQTHALFHAQLSCDVSFLRRNDLMDYSIMVGVYRLSEEQVSVLLQAKQHSTQYSSMGVSSPSAAVPPSPSRGQTSVNIDNSGPTGTQGIVSPTSAIVSGDNNTRIFLETPGPGCVSMLGYYEDRWELYTVGIIDCLTEYNMKKKSANFFKKWLWSAPQLSTVPPAYYAKRFLFYLQNIFGSLKCAPVCRAVLPPGQESDQETSSTSNAT